MSQKIAPKTIAGQITMAEAENNDDSETWMRVLLALRINQIAKEYPDTIEFAKKAGVSRATLFLIRKGQGNVTLETLGKLAANLDVSVWSLFGINDVDLRKGTEAFGLRYEDVRARVALEKARKDLGSLDRTDAPQSTEE